jgi:hypothetical protein
MQGCYSFAFKVPVIGFQQFIYAREEGKKGRKRE